MSEEQKPINERMRLIRWRMTREKSSFSEEFRVIPHWLKVLMAVLSALAQLVAQIVYTYPAVHHPFPPIGLAGVVAAISLVVTVLLFLYAYVNRDAARRGMNSILWTLVAIFVPYLIGIIVYFFVREPLPFQCPQCGATVSARFNYCSNCKFNLRPNCPQCKREVRLDDKYCTYCAHELKGMTAPAPQGSA